MKKIVSSEDIALLGFYKTILEDNNIACIIKNYYLTGGRPEIPYQESVPQLWVLNDEEVEKAVELLKSVKAQKSAAWKCACGEKIDGNFSQCWKCGKLKT